MEDVKKIYIIYEVEFTLKRAKAKEIEDVFQVAKSEKSLLENKDKISLNWRNARLKTRDDYASLCVVFYNIKAGLCVTIDI